MAQAAWKRDGKWEVFEQRLGGHLPGAEEIGGSD